jgi:hypothetical protein
MKRKRIFHYTVGQYLPSILKDGEIKVATTFVPQGERPAVWCSINTAWEETANKMFLQNGKLHHGDKETTAKLGGGLVRIEVEEGAVPLNWIGFKRMHKDKRFLNALAKAAAEDKADPYEWRMSPDPIPPEKWISIERWDETSQKWKVAFYRPANK